MAKQLSNLAVVLATGMLLGLASCSKQPAPTASSTSPDGRFRLELVEIIRRSFPADRNFDIVLIDLAATDARQVVFSSPDEGRPVGTEAFIWNDDSTSALLIGQHFYLDKLHVIEGTDGSTAYWLLDLETMTARCNGVGADLGRFSTADLEAAGFGEWLQAMTEEHKETGQDGG